ncbi:hypothetical protein ACFLVI_03555 [Chloroflexota bacterium]
MTWVDRVKQKFEEALAPFKGNRYPCTFCGTEGEYDEDLDPCITNIGIWGFLQGDTYTASVDTSFMCKDRSACQQLQEDKNTQQ